MLCPVGRGVAMVEHGGGQSDRFNSRFGEAPPGVEHSCDQGGRGRCCQGWCGQCGRSLWRASRATSSGGVRHADPGPEQACGQGETDVVVMDDTWTVTGLAGGGTPNCHDVELALTLRAHGAVAA